MSYAAIILDLNLDRPLDYQIPAEMASLIKRGVRVEVPVRGHPRQGYVLELKDSTEWQNVKSISKVISNEAWIGSELFELALWMSHYYCTPLQQIFSLLVPSSVRSKVKQKQQYFVMRAKTRDELSAQCMQIRHSRPAQAAVLDEMLKVKKGILLSELLELTKGSRAPVDSLVKQGFLILDLIKLDQSSLVNEQYFPTKAKTLSNDQMAALHTINHSLESASFQTHLLHGITGSGKTEVYMQAIECCLKLGRGVILLVPEIALTTQTVERFRSRFHDQIAVLHHRLSDGERSHYWHKIHRGEAPIVIGARSAVFSPVKNLGLIIVDEEHESSYKQTDEMPCYHARDVAVMRGKLSHCAVVLGSATPSLESYYNAQKGKYLLSTLSVRPNQGTLPRVTIVDMKREYEKAKGYTSFSDLLLNGIKKRQSLGEQTILFLNRRGYHTVLLCTECGKTVECKHCSLSLTFHKQEQLLACHLCGWQIVPPQVCPCCHGANPLKFRGIGTEQLENGLKAIFPDIRTLRIDADTTRHKGSHQKLFRTFATGKADVLIGTQMIAKGVHFPQVTLVGIINSDPCLNIPDFRGSETAFQMITQVAGRSGRGQTAGEVIIQTTMSDNSTITHAAAQDYVSFYKEEIQVREQFNYPPIQQMAKLMFSGPEENKVYESAYTMREKLIQHLPKSFVITPVVSAGYAKIKDKYRKQFFLRAQNLAPLMRVLSEIKEKNRGKVVMKVDMNPLSTF